MSMSEEEINALNENLKQLNETMILMVETMGSVTNQSKLTSKELGKLKTSVKDTDDAIDDLEKNSVKTKGALKNLTDSTKKYDEQQDALRISTTRALTAVTGFADALFSGEKGFTKFSGSLRAAGDASLELGKTFGGLGGSILGGLAKIITEVGTRYLEQADAQNNFTSEIYKMGGYAGNSTQELAELARNAGYSAKNLEKLTPMLKKNSEALNLLSGSTGAGTKKILEIFDVGDENIKRFYKLGYSLEELNETQVAYMELQRASGINLRRQGKDAETLRKDSLKYAENLRILSELTGKSVETIQQEQNAARAAYENVVANRADEARIRQLQLEADSTTSLARKQQIEQEIADITKASATRNQAIGDMAATFGQGFGEQFGRIMRTGTFDEVTGQLAPLFAQAGLDPATIKEQFAGIEVGSEQYQSLMAKLAQDLQQGADASVTMYETALQYGGEELGRALGLTKEFLLNAAKIDPEGEAERREAARENLEVTASNTDAQRELAATAELAAIRLGTFADDLLNKTNPLTGEFNLLTIATGGLIAAVGLASVALTSMSGIRGIGGMLGGGGTEETPRNKKTRLRLGRGFGAMGAVVGTAMALEQGISTNADINRREEEGEITAVEARQQRGANTGGTAGEAVGATVGAVAGAKIGAAIGIAGGPLGMAIGGFIGAGLGAWAGGMGGRQVGEQLGENIATSTTDELREAEVATPRNTRNRNRNQERRYGESQSDISEEMPPVAVPAQANIEDINVEQTPSTDIPAIAAFIGTDLNQIANTSIPAMAAFTTTNIEQIANTAIPTTARFESVSIDDIIKKNETKTDITNLLSLDLNRLINNNLALPRNIELIATVPNLEPTQIANNQPQNNTQSTANNQTAVVATNNETIESLEDMTRALSVRLDAVIDLLNNGNDIQDKIFRTAV